VLKRLTLYVSPRYALIFFVLSTQLTIRLVGSYNDILRSLVQVVFCFRLEPTKHYVYFQRVKVVLILVTSVNAYMHANFFCTIMASVIRCRPVVKYK
jgi:hypothetical protein